jgi:hypothetical protein
MQFFSLRFRGERLIEISDIPGYACIKDVQAILVKEFGGKYRINIWFRGKVISITQKLSDVLKITSPSEDGRYYMLYECLLRKREATSGYSCDYASDRRERYLLARKA